MQATRLRRGRNAAFVQADVSSEAGLGLRATFVFMSALASTIRHDTAPRAAERPPAPGAATYIGPDSFFTGNFEFLDLPGAGAAEWRRWARLRARDGLDPFVELMAIGDALPPPALKLFGGPMVPLSSLNWQINLTMAAPVTQDGWWLLTAATETARDGYSSQRMTIANAAGEPVADAMQAVAIFA